MPSEVGDELWGWQSQMPDGSWSLINLGMVSLSPPEVLVLIHREKDVAESMRIGAETHRAQFGQPIRFAHFTMTECKEVLADG
jgi:hypothetical protein